MHIVLESIKRHKASYLNALASPTIVHRKYMPIKFIHAAIIVQFILLKLFAIEAICGNR